LSHFFFIFSFLLQLWVWEFEMGGLVWDMCVLVGVFAIFFFLLLDWRVWGGLDWNGGEV